MSAQPNLDFYVRPPTRRQIANARLAEQRRPMYTWRRNTDQLDIDLNTGVRRHGYSSKPVRHFRGTFTAGEDAQQQPSYSVSSKANNTNNSSSASHQDGREVRMESLRSHGKNGDSYTNKKNGNMKVMERDTVWSSAVDGEKDRRRRWRQTNFSFSPDHFRTHRHTSGEHTATNKMIKSMRSSRRRPHASHGVYTSYIHDTIVFCEPIQRTSRSGNTDGPNGLPAQPSRTDPAVVLAVTFNAAEARARELQAAEEAKSGEMLSLSSLSPMPHAQAQRKAFNYVSSPTRCFDEHENISRPPATTAATTGTTHHAATGSLDDVSTPGDAKLKSANDTSAKDSYRAYVSKSNWCDMVGPTVASKQRALAMAEGIYSDLVESEAQRTGTAYGSLASLRLATTPTCELAYSLRASYMRSSGRQKNRDDISAVNLLPRSVTYTAGSPPSKTVGTSSSGMSRSACPGVSHSQRPMPQPQSSTHSRPLSMPQRPTSTSTALSYSGPQTQSLSANDPHQCTVTQVGTTNLVGASFLDEHVEKKKHKGAEEEDGGNCAPLRTADGTAATSLAVSQHPHQKQQQPSSNGLTAVEVQLAAPTTTVAEGGAVQNSVNAYYSTPLPQIPPHCSIPQQLSLTSSSEVVTRTVSTDSPLGGGSNSSGGLPPGSLNLTAPPKLSQVALEREMAQGTNSNSTMVVHQRTSHENSPTVIKGPRHAHSADSALAARPATGGGLGNCLMPAAPQQQQLLHGRRLPSLPITSSKRAASSGSKGRSCSGRYPSQDAGDGLQQDQILMQQHVGRGGSSRLPAEAKETRVYAVRMRASLFRANPTALQPREPPRRGVPVLLPEEWQ